MLYPFWPCQLALSLKPPAVYCAAAVSVFNRLRTDHPSGARRTGPQTKGRSRHDEPSLGELSSMLFPVDSRHGSLLPACLARHSTAHPHLTGYQVNSGRDGRRLRAVGYQRPRSSGAARAAATFRVNPPHFVRFTGLRRYCSRNSSSVSSASSSSVRPVVAGRGWNAGSLVGTRVG